MPKAWTDGTGQGAMDTAWRWLREQVTPASSGGITEALA